LTGNYKLNDEIEDRIGGAIWGASCGSSLGGSCVGLNHKEILATAGVSVLRDFVPGLSRSQMPDHQPGEIHADAALGLALADALIKGGGALSIDELRRGFVFLLENKTFLEGGPGPLCLAALRRMADGSALSDEEPESTHVSGAARAFPIGCLPEGEKTRTEMAVKQAEMTNKHRSVAAASAVIQDIVHNFVAGERLDDEEAVRTFVKREFALAKSIDERFADFWDDVAPDLDYSSPATDLPYSLVNVQSSVNECVPTSVGIFLIFRHDPEEAICAAARVGGDTDTAACIVGALSGAYHGVSKLPKRWLDKIGERDRIEKAISGLIGLWK
jgi:ADP-ribosylglycohydrolase